MEDNKDFFTDMQGWFKSLAYGPATLTTQVHNGKVVHALIHEFKQLRFGKEQNPDAIEYLLTLIKKVCAEKKTETVNLSVSIIEGNIHTLEVQRNIKKSYQKNLALDRTK